jgi:hypothetical protein
MAARKRAEHRTTRRKQTGGPRPSFRALADGLFELRVCGRVVLDVLVTLDGGVLTFVRVDGALLFELPVLGQA